MTCHPQLGQWQRNNVIMETGGIDSWHAVALADDLEEDDLITVEIMGRLIAVCRTGGSFHATDGYCTHEHEPLTDGMVIDGVIECPLHQGRFCARTGRAVGTPASVDLRTYPVRLENGRVFVRMPVASGDL